MVSMDIKGKQTGDQEVSLNEVEYYVSRCWEERPCFPGWEAQDKQLIGRNKCVNITFISFGSNKSNIVSGTSVTLQKVV